MSKCVKTKSGLKFSNHCGKDCSPNFSCPGNIKGNSSTSEVAPEPVKATKIEDIQPKSIISLSALSEKVVELEEKVESLEKWHNECNGSDKDIPF